MRRPGLPAEIASVLPGLVDDLVATLGRNLVGVYLYGSAITGGFDPRASDLDVMVVTATPTDEIELEVLAGIVDRLKGREPAWAERLDIAFVGRPTLASFRSGGPLVSISHELPLQRFDDADTWLQTWYLVRVADAPVVGPPVGDVVPPISLEEFVDAVTRDADRIIRRAQQPDCSDRVLAYTVLTLARVARARETGEVVPKDEAGRWLADRMPAARAVVQTAIAVRHRQPAEPGWADRARALTRVVLEG